MLGTQGMAHHQVQGFAATDATLLVPPNHRAATLASGPWIPANLPRSQICVPAGLAHSTVACLRNRCGRLATDTRTGSSDRRVLSNIALEDPVLRGHSASCESALRQQGSARSMMLGEDLEPITTEVLYADDEALGTEQIESDSHEDHYRFIRCIGRGAQGTVELVKEVRSRNLFVIKKIPLLLLSESERAGALQEVELLRQLSHPNIVEYRESFKGGETLNIVMAYCDGGDLASNIKRQAGLREAYPEAQIMNWFVQMLSAVAYLHGKHVLHRDLKSNNVFLTGNNIVQLGDFGIARVLDSTLEQADTVVGTPYYMSPEVCENRPYGYKSDVWALGCILFEMCALKHAFKANNLLRVVMKIVKEPHAAIPDHYTRDVNTLVDWLLRKNPDRRPFVEQILELKFVRRHCRRVAEASLSREEEAVAPPTLSQSPRRHRSTSAHSGQAEEPRRSTTTIRHKVRGVPALDPVPREPTTVEPVLTPTPRERTPSSRSHPDERPITASGRYDIEKALSSSGDSFEPSYGRRAMSRESLNSFGRRESFGSPTNEGKGSVSTVQHRETSPPKPNVSRRLRSRTADAGHGIQKPTTRDGAEYDMFCQVGAALASADEDVYSDDFEADNDEEARGGLSSANSSSFGNGSRSNDSGLGGRITPREAKATADRAEEVRTEMLHNMLALAATPKRSSSRKSLRRSRGTLDGEIKRHVRRPRSEVVYQEMAMKEAESRAASISPKMSASSSPMSDGVRMPDVQSEVAELEMRDWEELKRRDQLHEEKELERLKDRNIKANRSNQDKRSRLKDELGHEMFEKIYNFLWEEANRPGVSQDDAQASRRMKNQLLRMVGGDNYLYNKCFQVDELVFRELMTQGQA